MEELRAINKRYSFRWLAGLFRRFFASLKAIPKAKGLVEVMDRVSWSFINMFLAGPGLAYFLMVYSQIWRILFFERGPNLMHYTLLFNTMWRTGGIGMLLLALKVCAESKKGVERDLAAGIRDHKYLIFFGLMIVWIVISNIINGFTPAAYNGIGYSHMNISTYLCFFMIIFPASLFMTDRRLKRIIIHLFMYTALMMDLIFAVSALYVPFDNAVLISPDKWFPSAMGIFMHSNHCGYFMTPAAGVAAAMAVFSKNKPERIYSLIVFVLTSMAVSLTCARGALLASIATMIFLPILSKIVNGKFSKLALLSPLIFLASALSMEPFYFTVFSRIQETVYEYQVATTNSNYSTDILGNGRIQLWTKSIKLAKEKPIFGHGTNNGFFRTLEDVMPGVEDARDISHNEFLEYCVNYGFAGGAIYVAGCLSCFFRGLRLRRSMTDLELTAIVGAFGYLCSSFFGIVAFFTAPIVFIMLGLSMSGLSSTLKSPEPEGE